MVNGSNLSIRREVDPETHLLYRNNVSRRSFDGFVNNTETAATQLLKDFVLIHHQTSFKICETSTEDPLLSIAYSSFEVRQIE